MARSMFIAVLVVVVLVFAEAKQKCVKCKNEASNPVCASNGGTYRNTCQLERIACLFPSKDIKFEHEGECKTQSELGYGNDVEEVEEEEDDSDSDSDSDESDESDEDESPPMNSPSAEPPVVTSRPPPPAFTTTEMMEDSTDFVTEVFLTDIGTQSPAGMDTRSPTTSMAPPTPCATSCPLIDNMPVCGTDGITYTSRCVLEAEACMIRDNTLQVAYDGPCLVTLGFQASKPSVSESSALIP